MPVLSSVVSLILFCVNQVPIRIIIGSWQNVVCECFYAYESGVKALIIEFSQGQGYNPYGQQGGYAAPPGAFPPQNAQVSPQAQQWFQMVDRDRLLTCEGGGSNAGFYVTTKKSPYQLYGIDFFNYQNMCRNLGHTSENEIKSPGGKDQNVKNKK